MKTGAGQTLSPQAVAAHTLTAVLVQGHFLDTALVEALPLLAKGKPASLVRELCYGTLREYFSLRAIAGAFLSRPLKSADADVDALLLIGLYQLRRLRVPAAVSVSETVAAAGQLGKPWAKGLLNACLRRYLREPDVGQRLLAGNDEASHDHPAWLLERLRRSYPDTWTSMVAANNQRPPMTLRVNSRRTTREAYLARLRSSGVDAHACAVAPQAVVLSEAADVNDLPGFRDGDVSVQDAGAQLAAAWLDVQPGHRVLDACAAPGGKTAHLLEQNPDLAELTAVELDPQRAQRIRENLERLQLRAVVQVGDATALADSVRAAVYDRILCDAPCSATGVIRRHPDIKVRRTPGDLLKLVATQRQLLDSLWPILKTGGKLLYVTCSVLPDENEMVMADFLSRHTDAAALALPAGPGRERNVSRQIFPGEPCGAGDSPGMDGFFYALLAKH